MHGRNYIEKDIGLDIYRKKCLDIHQKRLQEIRGKPKKIEVRKVEEIMTRKNEEKHRNFEFMKQEKDLEVNRSNKKLLEKLVEISKGKHLSVEAFTPVNHTMSVSGSETIFRPKSLNIFSRKKESQKIEEDNFKFAKRLFESHGLISVKEMKEQFREHVKIKKHVRKLVLKNDKNKNSRHGLLPPLSQVNNTTTNKGTFRNQDQINDELLKGSSDSLAAVIQDQTLNSQQLHLQQQQQQMPPNTLNLYTNLLNQQQNIINQGNNAKTKPPHQKSNNITKQGGGNNSTKNSLIQNQSGKSLKHSQIEEAQRQSIISQKESTTNPSILQSTSQQQQQQNNPDSKTQIQKQEASNSTQKPDLALTDAVENVSVALKSQKTVTEPMKGPNSVLSSLQMVNIANEDDSSHNQQLLQGVNSHRDPVQSSQQQL